MDKRGKKLFLWTLLLYLGVILLACIDRKMLDILDFLGIHDFKLADTYMKSISGIINVYVIMGIFSIILPLYLAYKYDVRLHEKTETSNIAFGIFMGVVFIFAALLFFDTSTISGDNIFYNYILHGSNLLKYILDIALMSASDFLLSLFIIPRAVEKGFGGNGRGRGLAVILSAMSYAGLIYAQGIISKNFIFFTAILLLISACSVSTRSIYITLPVFFIFNGIFYSAYIIGYSNYTSWSWVLVKLVITAIAFGVFIFFSMKKRKTQMTDGENTNLSA